MYPKAFFDIYNAILWIHLVSDVYGQVAIVNLANLARWPFWI